MNKKVKFDLILISMLVFIAVILLVIFHFTAQNNNLLAEVYFENEKIASIDLHQETDERTFVIEGAKGEVTIAVKHNAIRIIESNCPNKDCLKQGWINKTSSSVICIPNKIYIKIIGLNADYDVEIG